MHPKIKQIDASKIEDTVIEEKIEVETTKHKQNIERINSILLLNHETTRPQTDQEQQEERSTKVDFSGLIEKQIQKIIEDNTRPYSPPFDLNNNN